MTRTPNNKIWSVRRFRYFPLLTLLSAAIAFGSLGVGAAATKLAAPRLSPDGTQTVQTPVTSGLNRKLSAKEALSIAKTEFSGQWTWTMSADQPGAEKLKTDATVTLDPKSGVFEIRGKGPDGSLANTTDWKPDAENGTWMIGTEEGKPLVLNYVSGKQISGKYSLRFKGSSALGDKNMTVNFDHNKFEFVIKYLPKSGSSAPGPITVTMLFERA